MSKELEPLADPGLPEHIHRKADTDPIAAKRAERQVAVLFSLSAFGTMLFIYSFFFDCEVINDGLFPKHGILFVPFGFHHQIILSHFGQ